MCGGGLRTRWGAMDSAVRQIVARAAQEAKRSFPVYAHMLRHACGYKLAPPGPYSLPEVRSDNSGTACAAQRHA